MPAPDIPIEFHTDVEVEDIDFYAMLEDRLEHVAKGHTDITGAAATIEKPAQGRSTSYIVAAKVTVYVRPNDVHATNKHEDPRMALKGALDAAERQIRQQRGKLREDRGSLDDFFIAPDGDDDTQDNR